MTGEEPTLSDLGERRILREIIPRYVQAAGDDCATVRVSTDTVVVTTDPVPRPAAHVIGGDSDPYWLGWLLVTINASDVAAAGARPEAFLAALDLPADYPVRLLERLLKGIAASCSANGLRYVGGNLRETTGPVSAVGTAIGSTPLQPLGRAGARISDLLVVLGEGGRFWEDALRMRAGGEVERASSPLFSPRSQAPFAYQLHEAGLLRCGMDTSDGLAPTLEELAVVNRLRIDVDLTAMRERGCYEEAGGRPERLWFGWGDWTVVAAVPPKFIVEVKRRCAAMGTSATSIGVFAEGAPGVELVDGPARIRASRLESERFAADSWFSEGIQGYINRLGRFALPVCPTSPVR